VSNLNDLVGAFLQGSMSSKSQQRMGSALDSLQREGIGGASQPGGASGGDLLGGLMEMVRGQMRGAAASPARAGGIGAVLGAVLGGGGDSVKGALGGGALAMLAGVAMKALMNSGEVSQGAHAFSGGSMPVGLKAPETREEKQRLEDTAGLVVKAMVNAAKADNRIDQEEMERIVGKLKDSGIDEKTRRWLTDEMHKPLDLDAFVKQIPDREAAAEVYAASLLAIEVDTQAERDYLQALAERTGLGAPVAKEIDRTMGLA
jgi:uncharacterized membrane protein YebE (DUF533 family)